MIAFMSNINIEPIKAFYNKGETYFCGYNQYPLEILNPASELYLPKIKKAFLFIDGDEFIKDQSNSLPDKMIQEALAARLSEHLQIIETYLQKRKDVVFILTNMVLNPARFTTYLETNTDYDFSEVERILNNAIKSLGKYPNCAILDWRKTVTSLGYNNLYDERFWYLGRIKLNNIALKEIKDEIEGITNAYEGKTKKVLVLDLDNTLWGGVIGEEGINGIQLSEDEQGRMYRDFQRTIKSLKGLGVLLAINSKNNVSDVEDVFQNHPMMVLCEDDFIVRKINWNDKVQNMQEIAQDLNLGLDAFVFIDDNPAERQVIRDNLPEVAVPEFAQEATGLQQWFINEVVYKYFPKIRLVDEDRVKHQQYVAQIQRKEYGQKLNVKEFITNLNVRLKIYNHDLTTSQRVSQLTQKTNQFNMTTRRYDPAAVNAFITGNAAEVYAVEYEDRFGKEGLVGASIVKIERDIASMDVFLLSCRVIGREVEYSFFLKILEDLEKKGVKTLHADFIETNKNKPFKDFYSLVGMTEIAQGRFEGDISLLRGILQKKISQEGVAFL